MMQMALLRGKRIRKTQILQVSLKKEEQNRVGLCRIFMKAAECIVYLSYIYRVSIVYLSYIYRVWGLQKCFGRAAEWLESGCKMLPFARVRYYRELKGAC